MSQFDFPRIHVRGLLSINVGTANNDDYVDKTIVPTYEGVNGEGPPDMASYKRLPMRLADTDNVQPTTFGRGDNEFQEWASQKLKVYSGEPETTTEVIPSEWNYFGDMGISLEFSYNTGSGQQTSRVVVASVQTSPAQVVGSAQDLGKLGADERPVVQPFIGASFSFKKRPDNSTSTAMIIDCSQEGSSQSSQIFCENLMLQNGSAVLLSRKLDMNGQYVSGAQPSKASTWWLNFQRNVNFAGPGGASGIFQTVMPFDEGVECEAVKALFERFRPKGETRAIRGVVFRYTLFRVQGPYRYNLDKLVEMYKSGGLNPGVGELVGTLAPWYADDNDETLSLGRLLRPPYSVSFDKQPGTFPIPQGNKGNGGYFRLAPTVARVNPDLGVLSLDMAHTIPEAYTRDCTGAGYAVDAYNDDTNPDPTRTFNPKYNLGTLKLMLSIQPEGGAPPRKVQLATLGFDEKTPADGYYGTTAYYTCGGMIDLPLTFNGYTAEELAEGTLSLEGSDGTPFLGEAELMILPRRPTLYTEQQPGGTVDQFNFNGTLVPSTLTVYKKGRPLTEEEYQAMVKAGNGLQLQEFRLNPIELQGSVNKYPLANHDVPTLDSPLKTAVGDASTKIFVVTQKGKDVAHGGPIQTQDQIDTLLHPILYVRVLPNEDYSQYYVDPKAAEPVGNETLTFGVIYEKVFRNYHLLYPAMSKMLPLNDPEEWATPDVARRLLSRLDPAQWPNYAYMPRTRDLSRSRRTLLQAWARRIIQSASAGAPKTEPERAFIGERLYVSR